MATTPCLNEAGKHVTVKKKGRLYNALFQHIAGFRLVNNGIHRARIHAGTTLITLICDHENLSGFNNGTHRTFINTCTAADTVFGNL